MEILSGNLFFTSCVLSALLLVVWKFAYRDPGISWLHALFLPLWSLMSVGLLGISSVLLPLTMDRYLYAADGSFGFQPAFAGARLLLAHPWLQHACSLCYFNLPLPMTLSYLLLRRESERNANRFVRFAAGLGIVGAVLYFACPAIGPGGALGEYFPYRAPALEISLVRMPLAARNCMPSLHTAWILCLLQCAPRSTRWFRRFLWPYALLTLLYTLSCGGHYVVDMIVAVPFSQAVGAAIYSRWKSRAFALNSAFVILWLVVLRYGLAGFAASPMVPYALTALTSWSAYVMRVDFRANTARRLPHLIRVAAMPARKIVGHDRFRSAG